MGSRTLCSLTAFACFFVWHVFAGSSQTELSGNVMFCTSVLDLAVGDSFNIRDVVVDRENPSQAIDWSLVGFYYANNDPTTWHKEDFNAGINVNLTDADVSSGDSSYRIFVKGSTPGFSSCSIRVWSSSSQLPDVLRDNLCGGARGSVMSISGSSEAPPTPNTAPSKMLRFCRYSLQLTIGDVFNIRDAVVYQSSLNTAIDWTKVVFYYSDLNSWRIDEFSRGKPFLISESDFGQGNRGSNEFRISMCDLADTNDQLTLTLTKNASASEYTSFVNSPYCGFTRGSPQINNEQRPYPLIVTVAFEYSGQINLEQSISAKVADLLGIPVQWVQDCPQKVAGTDCVQFVAVTLNGSNPNPEVWADRLMTFINKPSINDRNAKEWTSFAKATRTGSSALNNYQPLTYDAAGPAQDLSNPVYNGILIMGIAFILIMVGIVGFVYYRRAKNRPSKS